MTPLPGHIMPPLAVPGLDEEGVEESEGLAEDATDSLPGDGRESNHSCGGLRGGGPQAPPPVSLGGGKASGGT